ncbi:HMA5 [Symbiodinium natans]|uniref:HMA5 protein n=1 Tax=Symbiodinium natans TaxID=878477 RepID=A0A812LUS8_9DINO|nr:HMA5 [Symbiodinium natans]
MSIRRSSCDEANNDSIRTAAQVPVETDEDYGTALPEVTDALQGIWYMKDGGYRVGELCGQHVIWDVSWNVNPPLSRVVPLTSSTVSLQLGNVTHFGSLQLEAQPTIYWDNQHIWLKK